MGLRYRKRIKIAPGLSLNISKSGISTSIGGRGATINVSKKGVRTTVGIPGTGLSYSKLHSTPKISYENEPEIISSFSKEVCGNDSLNICTSCICLYPSSVKQCPSCGNFSTTTSYRKHRRWANFTLFFVSLIFCFVSFPLAIILLIIFLAGLIQSKLDYRAAIKNGGYFFSRKSLKVMSKNGRVWKDTLDDKNVKAEDGFEIKKANNQIDNFSDSLSTVWAEQDITIEFSYRKPNGETIRRESDLVEVLVNDSMEPYLKCFCHLAKGYRLFKYKRITSKILVGGVKYHKDDFLEKVLNLSRDDFLF
ncbi:MULTISPECIES: DUF4236 domain-containing protein [unclassified Pantoea]|uniref:DUF4236 domain-containing protein n=1 Tax=unclassified Pantoea TaxID=2630326 RepID=UPI0012320806|nr:MULTISPECIES: DUF4236 domain-containing protein [unclassified Pantoea]KAA5952069.1 DUF4236 domain-containing protein [Pantoea sp. VH_24]KAA5953685.1 DUF4236 domain-containing protein [Pantoea sp. VH_16]KAA5961657.1 DUF4236 domain-containing protein [Pantoea sp. VH_18]KAA5993364.1 DUF4236 domain-containing protein [Pantoea sp. M_1]KAA5998129.1 DUF4236 domain-containing protein [Pantoea sp. F_7]